MLLYEATANEESRHKFMVFVNYKNRYAVVLYGLKANDKKIMAQLIGKAIFEVFQSESIKEEIIDEYLSTLSRLTFAKTKNRKLVARLNKACEMVYFGEDLLDVVSIVQVEMSKWISSTLGRKWWVFNEAMYRDLLSAESWTVTKVNC